MTAPDEQPAEASSAVARRTRHRGWAALLLALSVAAAVLAAMVSVFFLALAAVAATGAYAAWLGVSAAEYLDLVDDATAPPTFPS